MTTYAAVIEDNETSIGRVPEREDVLVQPGEHLIAAFGRERGGPTLIVIGGLHGNEPAGVIALKALMADLAGIEHKLRGRVFFVAGNTRALQTGARFLDTDLNRCWRHDLMHGEGAAAFRNTSEGRELAELDDLLDSILITAKDEVFVIDLHSTSAEGIPFATVGDTLRNREFAQKFPLAIVLGIEEQLEGTLLEYLNNDGAVTLGFEGGQHSSVRTAENHRAVVLLGLVNAGIIERRWLPELETLTELLASETNGAQLFEILYRQAIRADDGFEMEGHFDNFEPVERGRVIARDRRGPIRAVRSGLILMPLYQRLGNDGFFIGQRISPFWLWLSGVLRRAGLQKIVHWLPGVSRDPNDPATLVVNTSVARLFPLQVFHLLGFRRRRWVGNKLVVSRRRHDTTGPFKWEARV